MDPSSHTRVKICCIAGSGEADLAIRRGASVLGLVSAMPSGPGPIEESLIATVARTIPPGIEIFLLTSKRTAEAIVEQHLRTGIRTLQLVDAVAAPEYERLREKIPGVRIVQVIHVVGQASLGEAVDAAKRADAILLDSGRPDLPVPELGGTGRRHDWSISRKIREAIPIPLFLAGGLNADNVREAIETVRPFGVDVCSGVRTNGKLDESKLAAFMAGVRAADFLY